MFETYVKDDIISHLDILKSRAIEHEELEIGFLIGAVKDAIQHKDHKKLAEIIAPAVIELYDLKIGAGANVMESRD
jgi:hypothetical protein